MPTISVNRARLFEGLGREYTDEEFDELCFEFGLEVDGINTDAETGEVSYHIEIAANRYDMLCIEGIVHALRVYLGSDPENRLVRTVEPPAGQGRLTMRVHRETAVVRPYCVCAVLRGVRFTPENYASFIDLQDRFHQNLCRRRKLVAIGTHDLSTLQPPFTYQARAPEDIAFVPLTEPDGDGARTFTGREMLDHYRTDPECKHLKPYTDLIYDSPVYPVIYDSNDVVLSLPPIINSKHSRIRMETTDIFIESTALDRTKADVVLDNLISMFARYCAEPFTVEPVDVIYEGDNERIETTPTLTTRQMDVRVDVANATIGVEIEPERMCELCTRMMLGPATYNAETNLLRVTVPPTRADIMHEVDVIEDIAIAYGYNNVPQRVAQTLTVGGPLPINHLCDLLRTELAQAGYNEVLTHGLCSRAENFTMLRHAEDGPAVSLANPANVEYEVVRTTLLPGALKTLHCNRSMPFRSGVRLFEISDIVLPATETLDGEPNEIGAQNHRHLLALYSGPTAGFEIIHGLVDKIMVWLQICPVWRYAKNSMKRSAYEALMRNSREDIAYSIEPADDPTFFPGNCGRVLLYKGEGALARHAASGGEGEGEGKTEEASSEDQKPSTEETTVDAGLFGSLHPEVLQNFELTFPGAAVELRMHPLLW